MKKISFIHSDHGAESIRGQDTSFFYGVNHFDGG